LDQNQIAYVKIQKPNDFETEVLTFLNSLKNRDFNTYATKGYALYQTLLEPVLAKTNNPYNNHLIIIPDGILGYLPFETLIQTNPENAKGYKDLDYLIKDHEISYHYSASLLAFVQPQKQHLQNSFIGFAPAFRDDTDQQLLAFNETVRSYIDSARALPYAEEEVKAIASLLGGNAYTGALATERSFKQDAGNYSIIHLASHSLVDDTDPLYSKLIFDSENDSIEDGLLHTYELYNMQLNADLVTLSACNTGVGKYYKGEGIVSLARGFMYAGVPNVMMSLWSVADRPTKDIMQYFYEELDTGTPYASALHKAKLRYLASADNLTADPYYWGAFIYLGQPIDHTGQSVGKIRWVIGFVLIVCLTAGGVIFMKKKYLR
jgi:CHAT domain-containing protein